MEAATQIVYEGLLARQHKSYWGYSLRNFQADPTEAHFKELVTQLQSQGRDDRGALEDILGKELAQQLMTICVV